MTQSNSVMMVILLATHWFEALCKPQLQMLLVVGTPGISTPSNFTGNLDNLPLIQAYDYETLIDVGKRQCYLEGTFLRQQYQSLVHKTINPLEMIATSSTNDLCMDSLYSVMSGFLSDTSEFLHDSEDPLLKPKYPIYETTMSQVNYKTSVPDNQTFYSTIRYDELGEVSDYRIVDPFNKPSKELRALLKTLYKVPYEADLYIEKLPDLPAKMQEAQKLFPGLVVDDLTYETVIEVAEYLIFDHIVNSSTVLNSSHPLLRYFSGIREVLAHIDNFPKYERLYSLRISDFLIEVTRLLRLRRDNLELRDFSDLIKIGYFAMDETLFIPLMWALKIVPDPNCTYSHRFNFDKLFAECVLRPPFASTIVIELVQTDDKELLVNTRYNGNYVKVCNSTLNNSEQSCKLTEFLGILDSRIDPDWITSYSGKISQTKTEEDYLGLRKRMEYIFVGFFIFAILTGLGVVLIFFTGVTQVSQAGDSSPQPSSMRDYLRNDGGHDQKEYKVDKKYRSNVKMA